MSTENLSPEENICLFAPVGGHENFLFPYQFVYETLPGALIFPCTLGDYSCRLITEGSCTFSTDGISHELSVGDVFFTFPGVPFSLSDIKRCKFLYITFVGEKIGSMLSTSGISRTNPVRRGYAELIDLWFGGLGKCTSANLSTLARGLLYYTLSLFPAGSDSGSEDSVSVISQIRDVIDRCYANPDLNLDYICRLYSYHPKYISRRFHESEGVRVSDYIESCRIRRAKLLLSQSGSAISDIALSVGYSDASYFSRVFRKVTGMSPTAWREQHMRLHGAK